MDSKKIGALLIKMRGKRTQREVAKAVGVTEASIRHYEQGNRNPSSVIKYRLSKFFETTVQELFFQDIFFE